MAKAGWLRPSDKAENPKGFLDIALNRAFPPAPVFKGFDVEPRFMFQYRAYCEQMDPSGDHWQRSECPHGESSWIAIDVDGHRWCEVGRLFTFMEGKHPGFGRWLCWALASPLAISPHDYIGFVSCAYWYGEENESLARQEYEANSDPEDKWDGPCRADFDRLIPQWAQHCSKRPAGHDRFLALARRLFGVDISPLFDAKGHHVLRDVFRPGGYLDAYERPLIFGWTAHDLIVETIDYCFNSASECGTVSSIAAAFAADRIKPTAAKLQQAWRVLSTLGDLAEAFDSYRAKFKIV